MIKKRIAIFQSDLRVGGIQKSLINLLNLVDFQRYEVDLYLIDRTNFFDSQLPEEVNVQTLPNLSPVVKFMPFRLARILSASKYRQLRNSHYDLSIDFNGYQQATAIASLTVRSRNRAVWIHGNVEERLKTDLSFRFNWLLQKYKFLEFNRIIVVSQGLVSSLYRLTGRRAVVVNNIIDSTDILSKSLMGSVSVDKAKYNVVSVGRLTTDKNVQETLSILKKTLQYRKDMHLYIIGDGVEMTNLRHLVGEMKITKQVTFLGSLVNPYVYMTHMDGYISTSRHEGQGMTILEAKCLGLDIFIPAHLEPYSYGVMGVDDLVAALSNKNKPSVKRVDTLADYNKKAIETFYSLVN